MHMQICSKVYCDRVYFLCTERIATAGADLAFLQGGGGYFTSREAASRFFLAILRAAKRL